MANIVKIVPKTITPAVVKIAGLVGPTGPTGPQGIQGVQGPAGALGNLTVGGGLAYDVNTNTLIIEKMDGGVI